MPREILVPVDGSTLSECAVPLAAALADLAGAHLELVRVCAPGGSRSGTRRMAPIPVAAALLPQAEEVREAQAHLARLKRNLAPELTGQSVGSAVLQGQVAGQIIRHGRERGADLVVMATRARGRGGRTWLGSVADRLVRRSRVPVMLLRPRNGGPEPEPGQWRALLALLDRSAASEQVLPAVADLAGVTRARLTLLHVVDQLSLRPGYPPVPHGALLDRALTRVAVADAQAYLERLAGPLRQEGLTVTARVVAHPGVAEAALAAAGETDADLIALATRGRVGPARLLLGSVADTVLRRATQPVLLLRPRRRPGEQHQWTATTTRSGALAAATHPDSAPAS